MTTNVSLLDEEGNPVVTHVTMNPSLMVHYGYEYGYILVGEVQGQPGRLCYDLRPYLSKHELCSDIRVPLTNLNHYGDGGYWWENAPHEVEQAARLYEIVYRRSPLLPGEKSHFVDSMPMFQPGEPMLAYELNMMSGLLAAMLRT